MLPSFCLSLSIDSSPTASVRAALSCCFPLRLFGVFAPPRIVFPWLGFLLAGCVTRVMVLCVETCLTTQELVRFWRGRPQGPWQISALMKKGCSLNLPTGGTSVSTIKGRLGGVLQTQEGHSRGLPHSSLSWRGKQRQAGAPRLLLCVPKATSAQPGSALSPLCDRRLASLVMDEPWVGDADGSHGLDSLPPPRHPRALPIAALRPYRG